MKYIFLIIYILFQYSILAENIPLGKAKIGMGKYLEIYEDKESELNLDKVQFKKFEISREENPSFGFTDSTYWVRFHFNNSTGSIQDKIIEVGFPLIDEITVFSPDEKGNYNEIMVGMKKPFYDRPLINPNFSFLIKIPPGKSSFYMKFKNEDSMQIPLILWEVNQFHDNSRVAQYSNGIYFGILFAMAAYNFFLMINVRSKSYFFYVIYIIFFELFLLSQQGLAYQYLWPDFSWGARRMNPLLAGMLEMSVLLFTKEFLDTKMTFPVIHRYNKVLIILCVIASAMSLFMNLKFTALAVVFLGILTAINVLTTGVKALISGFRPARYFMVAFTMLIIGALFYALKTFGAIPVNFWTERSMQIGSGLEVILLSLGLADRIAILINEKETAQKNLIQVQESAIKKQEELNKSIARFVPTDLLNFLGKKEITQVGLGDQIQKKMTLVFSDIRSFTKLSESMTPDENFKFINAYLRRMTPIIENRGGNVDKFIGDAILALFESNPENAILAAIEMQRELNNYNINRLQKGYQPLEIGIAIHTGLVMLGTVGCESRMEVTVISDTVNTASRIEGLTKIFGAKILISETVFSGIENSSIVSYRYLGKTFVKGKKEPLAIFEVFDPESSEAECIYKSIKVFEQRVVAYFDKEFSKAKVYFEEANKIFPSDKTTQIYLENCKHKMDNISSMKSPTSNNLDIITFYEN